MLERKINFMNQQNQRSLLLLNQLYLLTPLYQRKRKDPKYYRKLSKNVQNRWNQFIKKV